MSYIEIAISLVALIAFVVAVLVRMTNKCNGDCKQGRECTCCKKCRSKS